MLKSYLFHFAFALPNLPGSVSARFVSLCLSLCLLFCLSCTVYMFVFFSQESDWGIHAKRGGTICAASALVGTLVGFIYLHWVGAILSLCVALVLATFEVPFIYKFIEVCACTRHLRMYVRG